MLTTIKTEATIDGRSITATTEVDLPTDDMARIGPELERELRGQHVDIMARMIEEQRWAIATKRRAATP